MLLELRVRQLGLIEDLVVELGPGLTALTGETGAGKTLLVEAISLLLGAKADPVLVRPGAAEATVEGRFADPGSADPGSADPGSADPGSADPGSADPGSADPSSTGPSSTGPGSADPDSAEAGADASGDEGDEGGEGGEVILRRSLPATGRSRAWRDDSMLTLAALAKLGSMLVDIHGQHAHQTLLAESAQRDALDLFAGVTHERADAARSELRRLRGALEGLGGAERTRARELDLLAYQLGEIDGAEIVDADEDRHLGVEEAALLDTGAVRQAAGQAHLAIVGDDDANGAGAIDLVGRAVSAVGGRLGLGEVGDRLRGLQAELADCGDELRDIAERTRDDPHRLEQIQQRRRLLSDLVRKYGSDLDEVIVFARACRARRDELISYDEASAALEAGRVKLAGDLAEAEIQIGSARRAGAPFLAAGIEQRLAVLGMPRARFEVQVSEDPGGSAVTWLLAANPGEPAQPLAKVASGGELARTMLAVRLVLAGIAPTAAVTTAADGPSGIAGRSGAPGAQTIVFDEVDAGIGGEAAVAVGRALAEIGKSHQVLVITHLAQVAAFADNHLAVTKTEIEGRTVASVHTLDGPARAVELSRMLSGQPASATGRLHAEELLQAARADKLKERSEGSPLVAATEIGAQALRLR